MLKVVQRDRKGLGDHREMNGNTARGIPTSDTGADSSKVRSSVVRIRPYCLGKGERRDGEVENALEGNRIPGEVIPRQGATP